MEKLSTLLLFLSFLPYEHQNHLPASVTTTVAQTFPLQPLVKKISRWLSNKQSDEAISSVEVASG